MGVSAIRQNLPKEICGGQLREGDDHIRKILPGFTSMTRGLQVVSRNESKGKEYADGYELLPTFEELHLDRFPATT